MRRTTGLLALLALAWAEPLTGQDPDGWRLGVAAGPAVVLRGHDRQDLGDAGMTVRVATYSSALGTAWGLEGVGSWLAGAPGGDHRLHVGVTVERRLPESALAIRGGVGVGLVTVTRVEGPPPADGPAGDVVITTGNYGSVGLSLGVGRRIHLVRAMGVTPGADLLVQRGGGRTLGLLSLMIQVDLGAPWS